MKSFAKDRNRIISKEIINCDYVIIGGGLTGVCSAIAAAREGVKVVLVQDRPVLGGNASSEVRLWSLGATSHMGNNNRWAREGGVIDELMVENTYKNKEGNPVILDAVLIDKVLNEKNITLLLNTAMISTKMSADGHHVEKINAINTQNETEYEISATLFADCSGDGILAYLAGASYRMGAEEKTEYNEGFAPDKDEYGELLGHSIMFYIKDTGKSVDYVAPSFALPLEGIEEKIPRLLDSKYLNTGHHGCKYWWLEYGGRLDTIKDTEEIKYELWSVVYGVWNYIKNSGKFPESTNLTLEWVGLIPGKRESRRFLGHYMLTQNDLISQREHYDVVAHGGWSIDLHPSDGVYSSADKTPCNQWHSKGVYQIPYRCYVTPDVKNLFIGGRIISSSHVANGSTRVMGTAGCGGQAFGVAAAMCIKNGLKPADYIDKNRIKELQKQIIYQGQFLANLNLEDSRNLLNEAKLTASSSLSLSSILEGEKTFRLDFPAAQLVPVQGKVPTVSIQVKADRATVLHVELRSSTKIGNYTPDVVEKQLTFELKEGDNKVCINFEKSFEEAQYVFICFMKNPELVLNVSDEVISGMATIYNYINIPVSNYGKQTPPPGIGVEEFEFWIPFRDPERQILAMEFSPALEMFDVENLKSAYIRPFRGVNGWIPENIGESSYVDLEWDETKEISSIRLYFDTDAEHAMESVQMGHFYPVMPQCIRNYKIYADGGNEIVAVENNYQTINTIELERSIRTKSLRIVVDSTEPNMYRALMGVYVN